jgi:hypothetical protein
MDFVNQFVPRKWLFKAEIWNSRLKKWNHGSKKWNHGWQIHKTTARIIQSWLAKYIYSMTAWGDNLELLKIKLVKQVVTVKEPLCSVQKRKHNSSPVGFL